MGGGSKTTTVAAPAWLEDAAKYGLARAEQASRIGYTPYYGPDVAAMTPMQVAGMQGTNTAAGAFGLGTADPMAGMPQAQNFNGMAAYSSGPMYDQALAELERRAPGQYAALRAPFIDPVTGGQYGASSMQGKSASGSPVSAFGGGGAASEPSGGGGGGGSDRGMMSSGGGGAGSSSSGTIGGYTGIRDMFDGGGPGASGATFSGGPLSGVANAVGISPVAAAKPAPVVAPTVARVAAPVPAPTVFTSSADRVRAANSVANNALMGKAAVQKATEVGKALQGNRAADKALADKAKSQSDKNKAAADKAKSDASAGKGGKSGPSGGGSKSGGNSGGGSRGGSSGRR